MFKRQQLETKYTVINIILALFSTILFLQLIRMQIRAKKRKERKCLMDFKRGQYSNVYYFNFEVLLAQRFSCS